jgi:heparan-alpha-glucosaminide N-acetyltransferase
MTATLQESRQKHPETTSQPATTRLASMDAYRGLVMVLIFGEVLRFCEVAKAIPTSGFWKLLCHHQSHVSWIGCSLHDLIQPSFSFLVGTALPFSIGSRVARGQTFGRMTLHACWRALALVLLGVFLRSTGSSRTYWTFEDTLSQIGLGYVFLFLLGFRSMRFQWIAFALIVIGYWAAFALYPVPPADFDYSKVMDDKKWQYLSGFAAHWDKNTNLAWAFDTWFLNLFPREHHFNYNGGGYATLSFIPTLATMILGLIAGEALRRDSPQWTKVRWLAIAGVIGLASGIILGALGICPVVKRIWTPSWVLFSGGWCFLLLAAFYTVIDLKGYRRWAFPLVVIGMNSIAAYCIDHLFNGFIQKNLFTNLGHAIFRFLGNAYEPMFHGAATILVCWLILYWMYRRKIYLRI